MHCSPDNPHDEREIRERLRRLRDHQPDTSELEQRLDAAIDHEVLSAQPERAGRPWDLRKRWVAIPVAVGLVVALLIGVLTINQLTAPRVAEPQRLAAVHDLYERGELSFGPAVSIQQAERIVRQHWPAAPALPRFGEASLKGACVHRVQGCRVACLHMESEGRPLTLIVARNSDLCCREHGAGSPRSLDRIGAYHVLAWESSDRFVALVGATDPEHLKSMAATMRF